MSLFMIFLGIAFVILGVVFPFWCTIKKVPDSTFKRSISIGILTAACGLLFILQDRITSFKTPLGTIEAATKQAHDDADDIAKLKNQAENQTATINLVAKEAASAQTLSASASAQVKEAENKLAILNDEIAAAQKNLINMKQNEDFSLVIYGAESNNREDFDKLKTLADDKTNRFSNIADEIWEKVYEAHSSPTWVNFVVPWSAGLDPSKFSMEQLSEIYNTTPRNIQPGLIEYIASREDFSKISRLYFLIDIINNTKYLNDMEYAGRYFLQITKQAVNRPMDVNYISTWWAKHRVDYQEK